MGFFFVPLFCYSVCRKIPPLHFGNILNIKMLCICDREKGMWLKCTDPKKTTETKRKEIRDEKATNGVSFIGSVPCRVERTDRP